MKFTIAWLAVIGVVFVVAMGGCKGNPCEQADTYSYGQDYANSKLNDASTPEDRSAWASVAEDQGESADEAASDCG